MVASYWLAQAERRLGLSEKLAAVITDKRAQYRSFAQLRRTLLPAISTTRR